MTKSSTPKPSSISRSAAELLAMDMLSCLERFLSLNDGTDQTIDFHAPNLMPMSLPSDKAAYAVQLGFCLAPYFASMEALFASRSFIVIQTGENYDRVEALDALYEITVHEGARIAVNPTRHLGDDERMVLLASASKTFPASANRAASEAARLGLPLICITASAAELPDALKGPDLILSLPSFNSKMVGLVLSACHGERKAVDLNQIPDWNKLSVGDLVAHIRPGRPLDECINGLRRAVDAHKENRQSTSKLQLCDLAGYGEAKTWGLELADDFALWHQGKLSWEDVDHRAVVLAGPPGTGKTSFAGVLAATLDVPLLASSVAEWNAHDHLSGTLRRMQEVFDDAIARSPCVLLIDELDGISSRETIGASYSEYWTQIVNLMLELVTRAMATPGVIIVGATNHIERIDPALTRAGRLDETIRIELPDAKAIAAILLRYIGSSIPAKDLEAISSRLVGRTGADIEKLVKAGKASARRAGRTLSKVDLYKQLPDPLDKLSTQARQRIAIYRAGQFLVGQSLGLINPTGLELDELERSLSKVSLTDNLPTEQFCSDMLAMIMAGRAAEEIVLGEISTYGVGSIKSDLALATGLARDLEMASGFGENGLIYLDEPALNSILPISLVGSIRRRIEAAMNRASALLMANQSELKNTAHRIVQGSASGADKPDLKLVH